MCISTSPGGGSPGSACELPRPHDDDDDDADFDDHDDDDHDDHDDDDNDDEADDASPVVVAGPGRTQAFAVYIYIYSLLALLYYVLLPMKMHHV